MRATKAQVFVIASKCILVTLWITVIAIYRAHRGRATRGKIDQLLRWWSRKLLQHVGLSCKTFDPHHSRFEGNQPIIIMSNHSSLYDIPLIYTALPGSIRMLTKKELFSVPIWGLGLKASEFVSVDRDNRRKAIEDLETARKKMESGLILWIAPEGTRSRSGNLGTFKKGGFMLALRTGALIVPVGIRGAFHVLPPKTLDFHLGKQAEVRIGEPIDASRFSRRNLTDLMEQVESRIKELAFPAATDKS